MLRDLTDKVAWVTGAGTGIGEGGAVALAQAGMHVVLSGRREDKLQQVAERCEGRATIEVLDVADNAAVSAVAEIPHDVAFQGDLKARAIEAVEKELNYMWRHRFVDASELTPEQ